MLIVNGDASVSAGSVGKAIKVGQRRGEFAPARWRSVVKLHHQDP